MFNSILVYCPSCDVYLRWKSENVITMSPDGHKLDMCHMDNTQRMSLQYNTPHTNIINQDVAWCVLNAEYDADMTAKARGTQRDYLHILTVHQ